ncbi:MAG: hypothetical protein V3W41_17420, partial [Planctomycetota bacterium]
MEFLVNDMSLHGQFLNFEEFEESVTRMMVIRQCLKRNGYELHCHRALADTQVTSTAGMRQAVNSLSGDQRRAWMQWLTRTGPYWQDSRYHSEDDYLEIGADLVTDTAVGEAAVCIDQGVSRELVSFNPSTWMHSPIGVRFTRGVTDVAEPIEVPNHWVLGTIEQRVKTLPRPSASWTEVMTRSKERCSRLSFSKDAFAALRGQPFSRAAADRIRILLDVLDELKCCFNTEGGRNERGQEIYQEHFTGAKSWFSDASDLLSARRFRCILQLARGGIRTLLAQSSSPARKCTTPHDLRAD